MDSYANHPLSVGDIRSERSNDAKDWSPRDVLIDTLRRIDRGEVAPAALVVVMKHESDGGRMSSTETVTSSPSEDVKTALLARALAMASA